VAPEAWAARQAPLRPFVDILPLPAALCADGPAVVLLRSDGEASLLVGAEPLAPGWAAAVPRGEGGVGAGWAVARTPLLTARPAHAGERAERALHRRALRMPPSPFSPLPARGISGGGGAHRALAARPEDAALPWLLGGLVPGAAALGGGGGCGVGEGEEGGGGPPAGPVGVAELCVEAGAGSFAVAGCGDEGAGRAGEGVPLWGCSLDIVQAPLLVPGGQLRPDVVCVVGRGGVWRISFRVAQHLSRALRAWECSGEAAAPGDGELGAPLPLPLLLRGVFPEGEGGVDGLAAPRAAALHALALTEEGGDAFAGGATGVVGFAVPPAGPQWDAPAVVVAVGARFEPLTAAAPWVGVPNAPLPWRCASCGAWYEGGAAACDREGCGAPAPPPPTTMALVVDAAAAGGGAGLCQLVFDPAGRPVRALRRGEAAARSTPPALLAPGDVVHAAPWAFEPWAGGGKPLVVYAAPGGRGCAAPGEGEAAGVAARVGRALAAACAADPFLSAPTVASVVGPPLQRLAGLCSARGGEALDPLASAVEDALDAPTAAVAPPGGEEAEAQAAAEVRRKKAADAACAFREVILQIEGVAKGFRGALAARVKVVEGAWETHYAAVGRGVGAAEDAGGAQGGNLLRRLRRDVPQLLEELNLRQRASEGAALLAGCAVRARALCARAEAAAEAAAAEAAGSGATAVEEAVEEELLTLLGHARVLWQQLGAAPR
jgi:hypothetical protein